jgi:DNA polymerase III sliding clamp (beta) subunit (PCNA family)
MSAQITERPAPPIPSPLPDVIRITVPAQYDGEDWTDFSAEKTAEEVAAALRDRYPDLASVTLSDDGGWLRVIERPSWDAPVERYRLCGLSAADIVVTAVTVDVLHVRLVRLGCDDPEPEEPLDDREPDDNELIASAQRTDAAQDNEPTEETTPVIATETPDTELVNETTKDRYRRDYAAEEAERALAAASVPPKRPRRVPSGDPVVDDYRQHQMTEAEQRAQQAGATETNKTPPKGRSAEASKTSASTPLPSQQRTDYPKDTTPGALAVTVAREPLRTALRTVVTAAASGRLIVPVTGNVLIEADSAGLRLTCTDLSQRLSTHLGPPVQISVESTGAYTVPAKLLSDLVNTFTAPEVTLRQDGEVLRVTSGKSRGHLKGIDAAEFPEDRQDSGETWTLPAAVLRRALTLAEWAAARDEAQPVLKCVGLSAAGGRFVAQAADGTCLSYWSAPLAGVPDFTALLPRDAVETMARLLAAREGDVTLSLLPSAAQPNVLRLALGGEVPATLSTRTSEGQYPDLLRVVPKTHTLGITVQRAALLGAVRQAGVVADRVPGREGFRSSVLVHLRAEPGAEGSEGALHVWSTNASIGEQRTEITASVTSEGGEPLDFSLDGTYLVALIGALDEALDGEPGDTDDGAVTLRLTSALMPVRFGCAALPEWIGVLMPMTGGAV